MDNLLKVDFSDNENEVPGTSTTTPTTTVPEKDLGIAVPSDQLDAKLLEKIFLCKDTDLSAKQKSMKDSDIFALSINAAKDIAKKAKYKSTDSRDGQYKTISTTGSKKAVLLHLHT